jgi:hypothetical protein
MLRSAPSGGADAPASHNLFDPMNRLRLAVEELPHSADESQFCAGSEVGPGVPSVDRADARSCCRFSFSSFLASFARFRSARSNR